MIINGLPLAKRSNFPAGEIHIELPILEDSAFNITVKTKLKSAEDVIELLLVDEALSATYPNRITVLECHYIPYARQDRRCREREAFSLSIFAKLLNMTNFSEIICADMHSDEFFSLVNKPVRHITVEDIFLANGYYSYPGISNVVIVAPDRGAIKRASMVGGNGNVVYANKIRQDDGKIKIDKIENSDMIEGNDLLIVDDICDGGGTFIELCKELKKYNPKSISLYVTHGIFSKGIDILFDSGIKTIYTTNSYCELEPIENKLIIWGI